MARLVDACAALGGRNFGGLFSMRGTDLSSTLHIDVQDAALSSCSYVTNSAH